MKLPLHQSRDEEEMTFNVHKPQQSALILDSLEL